MLRRSTLQRTRMALGERKKGRESEDVSTLIWPAAKVEIKDSHFRDQLSSPKMVNSPHKKKQIKKNIWISYPVASRNL
jgi:hypothetical protein